MKNWKISMKLFVAFALIILLSCLTAVMAYVGMSNINRKDQALYNKSVKAMEQIGHISTNFQKQRVLLQSFLVVKGGTPEFEQLEKDLATLEKEMESHIETYNPTITEKVDQENFSTFYNMYYENFSALKSSLRDMGMANAVVTVGSVGKVLERSAELVEKLDTYLENCFTHNVEYAKESIEQNEETFQFFIFTLAMALLFSVLIAAAIAATLYRTIARPMHAMVRAANQIADGDMDIHVETETQDEVGDLTAAFRRMAASIGTHAENLTQIAEGNLTASIVAASEKDVLSNSIIGASDHLSHLIQQILVAARQVSNGANQISDGSQTLAQGTAEQATAIDELSSSVFEISLNTKENAKMAEKAAILYGGIKQRAQESTSLMSEMMHAVDEINQASVSISKIIKLINDIAFQTNILSLNAAVEAANAGQHGKGFAVVAGEVRNLAAKSAQAAADTDALIENSIEKARLGASIAQKTRDALGQIVEDIFHSNELMDDIAKASSEQALGVEQINLGIDQVAQVVNVNSSTAEQSALSAAAMATQAQTMENLVSSFKLKPEYHVDLAPVVPLADNKAKARKTDGKPVILLDENPDKY